MKVGSLEIDLLANIARLQQDMAKAQSVVGKSLGAMEQNIQRVMGTISKLGSAFSLILGGSAIGALSSMADDWGQINSKLKLATTSANEFNVVQKRLFDLTSGTHGSFEQISGLYVRTAESLRQLGYSTNETVGQVEALTYALNINATDTQQSNSVINAWSKAMLTGKMSAQEYNTIVAYSPRLQQALADSLGISNQALNEMAKEGKITSDVMVGVTGQIQRLAEEADEMPVTIGESFGRLRTHLMEYVGRANETYGVTEKITDTIDALASNIDIVMVGVTALGATALPALVLSLKTLTVAVAANPIGLLAVGIAATVAYFISIRDEIDKFNTELDALGAAWDVFATMFMGLWSGIVDFLRPVFGGVFNWLQGLWDKAVDATEGTEVSFDAAFMAVAGGIDTVRSYTYGALAAMSAAYEATASNIKNYFLSAYDAVIGGTVAMINGIIDGLNAINPFEQIGHIKGYEKTAGEIVNVLDAMSGAFNDVKTATDGHVKSLFENAKATRKLEREVEALEGWYEELNEAADSNTRSIISNTSVTDTNTKSIKANAAAITEAEKAIEELEKQRQEALKTQRDTISNIKDEIARRRDEITTFGQGKYAIDELAIARLKEQKVALTMMGAQGDVIELLQQEIEEREKLLGLDRDLDRIEEEARARQEMADEALRMNEEIGRTLTDALMRGFEDGKGFAETMRDTVVNMFKTMVLRPILQPIMQGVAGTITSALGFSGVENVGGIAQSGANALSIGSNLSSMYSAFTGGLTSSMASGIASLGSTFGSSAMSSFAAGMKGSTLASSLAGPTTAGAGGAMGAGAAFAAAMPWIAGGLAVASLIPSIGKMFKGETRVGGGFLYRAETGETAYGGGPSGGYGGQQTLNAVGQLFKSATDIIDSLYDALGINARVDYFHGGFESSGKGRGGTFSGGGMFVGDEYRRFGTHGKGQGYGGRSGTPEEMFERMTKDIAYSTLEAWQLVADQMPMMLSDMLHGIDVRGLGVEQAEALASEIYQIVGSVNLLTASLNDMPLDNLRNLSFDVAAGLIEMAGGADALLGSLGAYYQNFYTEAEQHEHLLTSLQSSFSNLNVSMPMSREGFRELADGIDVSTEAGQRLYVSLMEMSGAAAQFYSYIETQASQAWSTIESEMTQLHSVYMSSLREQHQAEMNVLRDRHQSAVKRVRDEYTERNKLYRNSLSEIQDRVRDLGNVMRSLESGIGSLRQQSSLAETIYRDSGRRLVDDALKMARSGKSLVEFDGLTDAVNAVSKLSTSDFASQFEFELERAESIAALKELEGLTGGQIDLQQLQIDIIEKQIEQLEDWRDKQLAQLDRQFELNQARAIARFERQMEREQEHFEHMLRVEQERFDREIQEMLEQQALQSAANEALVQGNSLAQHGFNAVTSAVNASASRISSALSNIKVNVVTPSYSIRGYASGGRYPGGMALVGEEGPELINFAQPGMVYTSAQSKNLMSSNDEHSKEMVALLRQLISMTSNTSSELRAVALGIAQVLGILRDVSQNGTELRVKEIA